MYAQHVSVAGRELKLECLDFDLRMSRPSSVKYMDYGLFVSDATIRRIVGYGGREETLQRAAELHV
jgi:hypothetical protein